MKVFCCLVFLLVSFTTFSQLTKGALLLEGAGGFNSARYKLDASAFPQVNESKSRNLSLRPSLGIMLSEKIMFGGGVDYTYNFSSGEYKSGSYFQNDEQISHAFLLSIFLRRYIQLKDKLYLIATVTLQGGPGTLKSTQETDQFDPITTKFTTYQAGVNLAPGLTYFISNKWAVTSTFGQAFVNFSGRKPKEDGPSKLTGSEAGLNFSLNTFSLGVQYFLRNGE